MYDWLLHKAKIFLVKQRANLAFITSVCTITVNSFIAVLHISISSFVKIRFYHFTSVILSTFHTLNEMDARLDALIKDAKTAKKHYAAAQKRGHNYFTTSDFSEPIINFLEFEGFGVETIWRKKVYHKISWRTKYDNDSEHGRKRSRMGRIKAWFLKKMDD